MRALLLILLAGCGSTDNVVGTWTGTCSMSSPGWPDGADLSLDITRDVASSVTGTGKLLEFSWDTAEETGNWSGEVEGTHLADQVTLELDIVFSGSEAAHAGQTLRLQIEGEKLEDTIHGSCQLSGVPGTISLTR